MRYPTRSRSVEITYSSGSGGAGVGGDDDDSAAAAAESVNAYWGLWINTGGWSAHHHFAIEPTTGRFDQVDRAVKDDSAGTVGASAQVNWTVTWALR